MRVRQRVAQVHLRQLILLHSHAVPVLIPVETREKTRHLIAFVEAVDAELWNSAGDRLVSFLSVALLLSLQLLSRLLRWRLHATQQAAARDR